MSTNLIKDYNAPLIVNNQNLNVSLKDIAKCKGESNSFFVRSYNQLLFLYKNNGKSFLKDEMIKDVMKSHGIDNLEQISALFKAYHSITEVSLLGPYEAKQLNEEMKIAIDLLKLFKNSLNSNEDTLNALTKLDVTESKLTKIQEIIQAKITLEKHDPEDLLKSHLYNQRAGLEGSQSGISSKFFEFLTKQQTFPSNNNELGKAYKSFVEETLDQSKVSDKAFKELKGYVAENPMKFYLMSQKVGNVHAETIRNMELKDVFILMKMNSFFGVHQPITSKQQELLIRCLNGDLKNNFQQKLREEGIHQDPHLFLNSLLDESKRLWGKQLDSILTGKNTILYDEIEALAVNTSKLDLVAMQLCAENQMTRDDSDTIKALSNTWTQAIQPRNFQFISDCLFPDCVIYNYPTTLNSNEIAALSPEQKSSFEDKEVTSQAKVKRFLSNEKANEREGSLKGFKKQSTSDYHGKSVWSVIEDKNNQHERVFQKGTLEFTFQGSDGHLVRYNAELDLSSLGTLSRNQVKEIFHLFSEKAVENPEVLKKNLELLKKTNTISEAQFAALHPIALKFQTDVIKAYNLALLTVGHEQIQQ